MENRIPKDMKRLRKYIAMTLFLSAMVITQVIMLFAFHMRNIKLQTDYNRLLTDYQLIFDNFDDLKANYTYLNSSCDQLQGDYYSLNATHAEYLDAYRRLKEAVNLRSSHPDENEKCLITPEDSTVRNITFSITGGWSDPSNLSEFWGDVKKMYDWVEDNIEYQIDHFYPILPADPSMSVRNVREMWQLPNETLSSKKGDCEDQAILLTSMLYCYDEGRHRVECIVTTNHVSVYIPVANDEICILDPAMGYYSNTGWPLYEITSKDIRQEVNHWINHHDLGRVCWVFSSNIWESFASTYEFIDWMYGQ